LEFQTNRHFWHKNLAIIKIRSAVTMENG